MKVWVHLCKTCRRGCFFALPCSTANWWERSPNYNNSNNFCNVNTNGNANNNNARNSNGLAPDFVNQKWLRSTAVTRSRVNYDLYERRDASRDASLKLPLMLRHGRRRGTERAWRAMYLTPFHVWEQSILDDTLQDICTEGE